MCIEKKERRWRKRHPEFYLWRTAKQRAAKEGREFTITVADVIIPERCPILGIPIEVLAHPPADRRGPRGNSASIDRIDNRKGYIPGNVRVISQRANCRRSKS